MQRWSDSEHATGAALFVCTFLKIHTCTRWMEQKHTGKCLCSIANLNTRSPSTGSCTKYNYGESNDRSVNALEVLFPWNVSEYKL